jgi:hypothetical protein
MLKMGEMEKNCYWSFQKNIKACAILEKISIFFPHALSKKKEVFSDHNTIHEHLRQARYLKTKFKLHSKEERKAWLVLC